jgi:hypothetical protein
VLTNGAIWRLYKIIFAKPIDQELLLEFNLMDIPRKGDHPELWLLSREGWNKGTIAEYHSDKQALSRYLIAATLLSTPVLNVLRRELRRVSPDAKISAEGIKQVLQQEVIKREVLDGEKFQHARKQVARAASNALKVSANSEPESISEESEPEAERKTA